MRILFVAPLLAAATALAQGKPTVIDYPLDVKSALSEAQTSELQADFRFILARNGGIRVPTRSNWQAAVAALKRQDCDIRNECLQQLSTTAATLYALYASVQRNAAGTELVITGRVVNQDGVQARAPLTVTVPAKKAGSFNSDARDGLALLLARLELEKLPPVLTPAVAVAAVPPKRSDAQGEPPPMPPPELVQATPSGPPVSPLRVAAWVSGGAAVAGAAVAIGFGASAVSARGTLPADGHLIDAGQTRTQATVNQGATIALIGGIAAAVFAGTSVALFVGSAAGAEVSITPAPTPGGAAMVLGGRFP